MEEKLHGSWSVAVAWVAKMPLLTPVMCGSKHNINKFIFLSANLFEQIKVYKRPGMVQNINLNKDFIAARPF